MPDWLGQGRYLPTWDAVVLVPRTPSYTRALTRAVERGFSRACVFGNGMKGEEFREVASASFFEARRAVLLRYAQTRDRDWPWFRAGRPTDTIPKYPSLG